MVREGDVGCEAGVWGRLYTGSITLSTVFEVLRAANLGSVDKDKLQMHWRWRSWSKFRYSK